MNKSEVNIIWESICATCLSQDRKLYPPSDRFATCFQDLSLSENDKLCWECHHTVLKMAAFRCRVQQAQAVFADLLSGKNQNVRSLSRLSLSKMAVDTFHTEEATDVKTEFCLELVKEEPLDTPSFDVDVKCEVNSDDEMGDENSEVNDEMGDECDDDDDDDDETLIEILKRKKPRNTTSIIMPTLYVLKGADTSETEDTSANSNFTYSVTNKIIPVSNAPKDEKEKDKLEVNPHFTYSGVMTKDDIVEWRKRKELTEFYTSSEYKCEKCIEPFENLNFYRNHEKRHTKLYGEVACEVCEMRTSDAAALAHHMKSQHRLLKCNHCAHEWDNANAMRRHCSEAHAVPIAAWGCDQCGHEFGSWQKLSVHSRTHRVRSCPECGLLLRSSLERHMLRAHPDLPSRACWVCSAECKGDSGLKAHMERHKKNSEAAYCAECDVHFSNKYVYRAHLRKTLRHAAPEDLKYRCEDCNIGFLDQYALTNHIDAVHDKQDKYPCEHCGEAFHTVVARKKHVRSAHEGRGPHKDKVCEHCGKGFTTKLLLAQHVNSHTGARPYKCTRCGAAFGFKSALYKHGRLVHKLKKKTG